jgi:hypothetical protein
MSFIDIRRQPPQVITNASQNHEIHANATEDSKKKGALPLLLPIVTATLIEALQSARENIDKPQKVNTPGTGDSKGAPSDLLLPINGLAIDIISPVLALQALTNPSFFDLRSANIPEALSH